MVPEWPTHLPSGCPSNDVPNTDGEAYRALLRASGSIAKDWTSHAERCPNGCDYCNGRPPCQRGALSVQTTLEDAREYLRVNKRYLGLAKATLRPEHGKIAQTTDDKAHYSLWLRRPALDNVGHLFSFVPPESRR